MENEEWRMEVAIELTLILNSQFFILSEMFPLLINKKQRCVEMYLTKDEEKTLGGEYGEVQERLFRLLVRLGDIYGAEKMVPVG